MINLSLFHQLCLGTLILLVGCSSLPQKFFKKQSPKKSIEIIYQEGPTGKGDGSFKDQTENFGLSKQKAVLNYLIDWDNDGDDDLVILESFFNKPLFFEFDKKNKRFSALEYNPFGKELRASFLVFADFNKDQILDVIVAVFNQKTELRHLPLRLFKGQLDEGNYSLHEVDNAFPSIPMPTASLVPIDFDLDGHLDLFIGNAYTFKKGRAIATPDRLYKGNGLKFTDSSYLLKGEFKKNGQRGPFINATPTYGSSLCDMDQNGYADILTASFGGLPNHLWLNVLDRQSGNSIGRIFKDVGKESQFHMDEDGKFLKRGGGYSFYTECIDYNNDRIMDVAVGELFQAHDPESRDRSSILTGTRYEYPPKFIRTEYHMDDGSGQWTQGDKRGVWADFNLDGHVDLIIDNAGFPPKSRFIYFEQSTDHAFADLASVRGLDILNPSGSVVGDFNADGRPDFLTGQTNIRHAQLNQRMYLMTNQYNWNGRRSLRLFLQGDKANSKGIGALITVTSTKMNQTRMNHMSSGFLPSQNAEGLIFGFDKGDTPVEIEVRWPILYRDRAGHNYPLVRKYFLKNLDFKYHLNLTLCESGRYKVGRKSCSH